LGANEGKKNPPGGEKKSFSGAKKYHDLQKGGEKKGTTPGSEGRKGFPHAKRDTGQNESRLKGFQKELEPLGGAGGRNEKIGANNLYVLEETWRKREDIIKNVTKGERGLESLRKTHEQGGTGKAGRLGE